MIKFALASDHGGLSLKEDIITFLKAKNIEYIDLGPNTDDSVSYAEYGHKLAEYILENKEYKGIGICGTGLGISYALNRHPGIRAARVRDIEDAELAKQHNDANVLVFGGRQTSIIEAMAMIEIFRDTKFEGGRHQDRIDGIELWRTK